MITPNAKTMKHAVNGQLRKEVNFNLVASSLGTVVFKELIMKGRQLLSTVLLGVKKKER